MLILIFNLVGVILMTSLATVPAYMLTRLIALALFEHKVDEHDDLWDLWRQVRVHVKQINQSIPGDEWKHVRKQVRHIAYKKMSALVRLQHRLKRDLKQLTVHESLDNDRALLGAKLESATKELDELKAQLAQAAGRTVAAKWQDLPTTQDGHRALTAPSHLKELLDAQREIEELSASKIKAQLTSPKPKQALPLRQSGNE